MPPKTNKATEAKEVKVESAPAVTPAENPAAVQTLSAVNEAGVLTTSDATSDELVAEAFTHSIKAAPAKGFHRAEKFWSREETKVNQADFTDDQWAALEAEPMLTITTL